MSEKVELAEGFIEFHAVCEFADIHHVEVFLPFRGQGFGSKLMVLFLAEMRVRGVEEVTLEVRVDNLSAIGLYEKFGFERVGLRKGYYKGVDGILMKKSL